MPRMKDERWWSNNMDSRSVSAWMGLSFELVCLAHHRQIKAALGIAGVGTAISSWRSKADSDKNMPGFQIDMIIERADRIIHLCEMKFSTDRYAITDNYEMKLRAWWTENIKVSSTVRSPWTTFSNHRNITVTVLMIQIPSKKREYSFLTIIMLTSYSKPMPPHIQYRSDGNEVCNLTHLYLQFPPRNTFLYIPQMGI